METEIKQSANEIAKEAEQNNLNIAGQNIDITIINKVEEIEKISKEIDNVIKDANVAQLVAKLAKEKEVSWCSGKVDAIEALQRAVVSQSKAMVNITSAQQSLFNGLKKISDASKQLYMLGVSNMAMNRAVTTCLKNKLKDMSHETMNEYAKSELFNILEQLQAQEDMFNRIDKLNEKNQNLERQVNELAERCDQIEKLQKFTQLPQKKNTLIALLVISSLSLLGVLVLLIGMWV